jgi:flagellar motor switch protein FliN/FliY
MADDPTTPQTPEAETPEAETPEAETPEPGGPAPAADREDDSPSIDAMAEAALESAASAASALEAEVSSAGTPAPLDLPALDGSAVLTGQVNELSLLDDVDLQVKVELGRTRMYVQDILRLGPDAVVELDRSAGDPVDIYVNDRLVARGEVLVLDDNFCVRVTEIIQPLSPARP